MSTSVANAGIQLSMHELKDYVAVLLGIILKLVNGSAINEHLLLEGKYSNTAHVMDRRYNKTCRHNKPNTVLYLSSSLGKHRARK